MGTRISVKSIIIAVVGVMASILASSTQASSWQVCKLEVEIIARGKQPYPELQGRVASVKADPADAQCPKTGTVITFEPESADWQSMIPRKLWPASGQWVRMRYQYLDGICKGDGNSHPCRIEHYPMDW